MFEILIIKKMYHKRTHRLIFMPSGRSREDHYNICTYLRNTRKKLKLALFFFLIKYFVPSSDSSPYWTMIVINNEKKNKNKERKKLGDFSMSRWSRYDFDLDLKCNVYSDVLVYNFRVFSVFVCLFGNIGLSLKYRRSE